VLRYHVSAEAVVSGGLGQLVGQFMTGVRWAMTRFAAMAPQKRRQARAADKAQHAQPARVQIGEFERQLPRFWAQALYIGYVYGMVVFNPYYPQVNTA